MKWEGEEESSNVEDRRTFGKAGLAVGGIGGLLLLLIGAYFGIDPQQLNQLIGNAPVAGGGGNGQDERPLTAEEAKSGKFAATILRFTEKVWDEQFQKAGKTYEYPHMVLFSRQVQTGCGAAPSAVGPFYCPADKTVYLDPTFFDELERRLGGSKAEFSQAYVIAHEVGHHVQNLLGYSRIVDGRRPWIDPEVSADKQDEQAADPPKGDFLRLLPRFWAAVLCGPLCEWVFCDGPYFPIFCLVTAFISVLLLVPYIIKLTCATAIMMSVGFCIWYGVAFMNIAAREY